jgi:hypothetical protein
MIAPSLRLCVDWIHIRQAERQVAAASNRVLAPVGLALVEQIRPSTGRFTDDTMLLIDGPTYAQALRAQSGPIGPNGLIPPRVAGSAGDA